ncbi:MAG: hypothetical protein IIZ61_02995 [Lachnospiraceae bacterium]|nr:hypothetical protein [Lachnospiraceae bacterium]
MFDRLERKFGKYAIRHLINYLLIGYGVGYLFVIAGNIFRFDVISLMTLEPYYIIHGLQFWRLITWIMIPPYTLGSMFSILLILIMVYFYWQLGTVLEANWGTFRFNVYMFGGLIFTLLGSFIYYLIYFLIHQTPLLGIGSYISTTYVNMSIFLAFAMSFPEMKVYLYFIIPIKMKWMAIVYAVITVYEIIVYPMPAKVAIVSSLLNFVIFFLMTRNLKRIDPRDIHRRNEFKRQYNAGMNSHFSGAGSADGAKKPHANNGPVARHKCAICGRTEISNPELTFRFCSKCNGNYEYCEDHLFTHTHKQ